MAAKTPDPYAARGKQLASAVQKLRGWVGSDPSKTPELADALVQLTEHRLQGHRFAEAAPEAQESAAMAGKLLTADGPLGPYTPVAAAARYLTAAVHLATIQSGLGLAEPAAKTIAAALDLHDQLPELDLRPALAPSTIVWSLIGAGRAALLGGDVEAANAYADAVLLHLQDFPPNQGYAALDGERFVGTARWSAGWTNESLAHTDRTRELHDQLVDGRLTRAAQLSPALVARLAEPLHGVRSELADRLLASGDHDRGLTTRRDLIELLRGLVKPLPDSAPQELDTALVDLAVDLELAGRPAEADAVRAEGDSPRNRAAPGPRLEGWSPLTGRSAFATSGGQVSVHDLEAAAAREAEERAAAERVEAHRRELERAAMARRERDRVEAERVAAERVAAEQAAAERAEAERQAAARAEQELLVAEQQAADEQAAREESQRRREERLEAHRLEVERAEADRLEADRVEALRRAAALDPAEAERQELERLAAELAALEATERPDLSRPDHPTADRDELLPEPVEGPGVLLPEPVEGPGVLLPEPVEGPVPQPEPEPKPQPQIEPSPPVAAEAPSELDVAREAWRTARASGDRRAVRAATERVSDLLRPLAERDPRTYGPELVDALQQLSSARLRGGDLFGSRGPAREAKALARQLGL